MKSFLIRLPWTGVQWTRVQWTRVPSLIRTSLTSFWADEQGQDLVEYALLVAAVGLALIATVNTLSQSIVSLYTSITAGLATIGAGGQ